MVKPEKFSQFEGFHMGMVMPYYSEGEFSMHELLEYILSETGPAEVMLTSFSITEVAIRTFLNLTSEGKITGLQCIFDLSVKQHKAGLLFFASNITLNIALAKCHAKLILIMNEKWRVAVVSSANMQINDKIEAGIVATTLEVFNFYYPKFVRSFDNSLKITHNDFR